MRPLVVAGVAALVVLAGCPALGAQQARTETLTPVPLPPTDRPLPPGVTDGGVAPSALVDAHVRRLAATNYTLTVSRRVRLANGTGENGTVSVFERVRRVAAGGRTYAGRYGRTAPNPLLPVSTLTVEYWTAGDGYATRHRDAESVVFLGWSPVGEPVDDVDRSRQLERTFSAFDLTVVERTDGGVVLTDGRPGSAPDLPTPPFVSDQHDATLTVRVTADGLVADWRLVYDGSVADRPVRVVYDGSVTAVGATTVGRPDWVDRAQNRSGA